MAVTSYWEIDTIVPACVHPAATATKRATNHASSSLSSTLLTWSDPHSRHPPVRMGASLSSTANRPDDPKDPGSESTAERDMATSGDIGGGCSSAARMSPGNASKERRDEQTSLPSLLLSVSLSLSSWGSPAADHRRILYRTRLLLLLLVCIRILCLPVSGQISSSRAWKAMEDARSSSSGMQACQHGYRRPCRRPYMWKKNERETFLTDPREWNTRTRRTENDVIDDDFTNYFNSQRGASQAGQTLMGQSATSLFLACEKPLRPTAASSLKFPASG